MSNSSSHTGEDGYKKIAKLLDPRAVDAQYRPFPPFAEWSQYAIDTTRWNRYSEKLEAYKSSSQQLLNKASDVAKRVAAIDTGAIEGLYQVDRGFTFTVALRAAGWEHTLNEKGEVAKELIESQIKAYDYVLDFVTKKQPIAQAWIRDLHKQLTEKQETYRVLTEIGWNDHPLPHGEYKSSPNHVITSDEKVHAYAPVTETPTEMFRFCQELESEVFLEAHPVLQAAYAHYAFVAIHPFADGNGRVARALASIYTYRAVGVPLLILFESRPAYLQGLQAADKGDPTSYIAFIHERILDAMQLIEQSLKQAISSNPSDSVKEIQELYTTKGGYTVEEVDSIGTALLDAIASKLSTIAKMYVVPNRLKIDVATYISASHSRAGGRMRGPLNQTDVISLSFSTTDPVDTSLNYNLFLNVPEDCGRDDDFAITKDDDEEMLTARISEITPNISGVLDIRIQMLAEFLIADGLEKIRHKAVEQLKKKDL